MALDLERTIAEFVREAEGGAVGVATEAIVLYGSAASAAFVPGKSDLNFLIVLDRIDEAAIERFQQRMKSWSRRRIASPLVVERSFLGSSTDSYPLEILGMMAAYRVLRGNDPFEGLNPAASDVRLQAEREAKAKGLLLRSIQIESCGREAIMRGALVAAVPALDSILRGILFLAGENWRGHGDEFRRRGARAARIEEATPLELAALRRGEIKRNREEIVRLYGRTRGVFDGLSEQIDRISRPSGSATSDRREGS